MIYNRFCRNKNNITSSTISLRSKFRIDVKIFISKLYLSVSLFYYIITGNEI